MAEPMTFRHPLNLALEQAEDGGLWFEARTAPEAYLQQELRRLHEAVERFFNLEGRAATEMQRALRFIAGQVSTDEGDRGATADEFGLPASEIIEMAHDNMIETARNVLAKFPAPPSPSPGEKGDG